MNLPFFISRRLRQQQQDGFSSTTHKIAVVSIGIGLAAVIVSFLIMRGFQETVKHKIFNFSGHLLITKYSMSNSLEGAPMDYNIEFYKHYDQYPGVAHVQEYAYKTGLIKTDDEVLGIAVKGVGKSFDINAFAENIIEGEFLHFPDSGYSTDIVLSKTIADLVRAKVGDKLVMHFFQNPPRLRRLTVVGIYETNLTEYFDSRIIIGDLRMIQRLNGWADGIAGGLEVFVKPDADIDETGWMIKQAIDFDQNVERVSDHYLAVFEWLGLLSRQVNILLVIILTVVCVNMISIVLILVMERTQMIGILKALGASDGLIRNIFVHSGVSLIVKGLLFGNVLGLGLCFVQYQFKVIELNPHDYYMAVVPISWQWDIVLLLNLLTFVMVSLVLLLPTMAISRVNPIRAIRFD